MSAYRLKSYDSQNSVAAPDLLPGARGVRR